MTTTDTTAQTTSPLAAACEAGAVRLYRLRSTGTRRAVSYLTGGAREVAEWLAYRAEELGVAAAAAEASVSRATYRRTLAALALTEEIEAGDHDDLWEEGVAELEFGGEDE